jgi:pSer/pThr/pTyr-binding forkhead associated (FHA) protein
MQEKTSQIATEVTAREGDGTAHTQAAFVLTVTSGPERGRSFRLEPHQPTRILLGTSPSCEIRLDDRQVSRRHAGLDRVAA